MKVKHKIKFLLLCLLPFLAVGCNEDETILYEENGPELAFATKELRTFENITPLQVPVTLTSPAQQDVYIRGEVKSEINAKEGVDYTFYSKSIIIPKGKSVGYFEVELKDDIELNPDRIFEFEIVEVTGARLNNTVDVCRVIISSDEGFATLGFEETLISTPEEQELLEISISLNRPSELDVTFSVRSKRGSFSAIMNEHYRVDEEAVYTIPAGETKVVVPVEIIDDIVENENREFELEIYRNENCFVSQIYAFSRVTIVNDEKKSFIAFDKTSFYGVEGESVWIPVRIDGHPRQEVRVTLEVRSGDAEEGTDIVFSTKELVFPVSTLVDSVRIDFMDNDIRGLDKTFTVGLTNLVNVDIASKDTLANVTIANDDFDYNELYEQLMGEWTLTHDKSFANSANGPGTTTLTISGGDTPAEEDANYLKYLIVKCAKFGGGSHPATWRLSYNPENGELAVIMGETITKGLAFGNPGVPSNVVFDRAPDYSFTPVKIYPSRDYKTLTWDPEVVVNAALYYLEDHPTTPNQRWSYWFNLKSTVMTRKK